jgi:hypothetical protein
MTTSALSMRVDASIEETIEPALIYSTNDVNRAISITSKGFITACNYNSDVVKVVPWD